MNRIDEIRKRYSKHCAKDDIMYLIKEIEKLGGHRWIVPKEYLRNGKLEVIPSEYHEEFKLLGGLSFESIIRMLYNGGFRDVYIFDLELPNDTYIVNRVSNIIRKLGRKSLRIHYCTDDEIPRIWKSVFNNIAILSVPEGVKQVK